MPQKLPRARSVGGGGAGTVSTHSDGRVPSASPVLAASPLREHSGPWAWPGPRRLVTLGAVETLLERARGL